MRSQYQLSRPVISLVMLTGIVLILLSLIKLAQARGAVVGWETRWRGVIPDHHRPSDMTRLVSFAQGLDPHPAWKHSLFYHGLVQIPLGCGLILVGLYGRRGSAVRIQYNLL